MREWLAGGKLDLTPFSVPTSIVHERDPPTILSQVALLGMMRRNTQRYASKAKVSHFTNELIATIELVPEEAEGRGARGEEDGVAAMRACRCLSHGLAHAARVSNDE